MLEGFAFCRMLYDDNGHPADFIYLNVNSSFNLIIGTTTVIGKPVTGVFLMVTTLRIAVRDL
jgi:hypothetical protein